MGAARGVARGTVTGAPRALGEASVDWPPAACRDRLICTSGFPGSMHPIHPAECRNQCLGLTALTRNVLAGADLGLP